MFTLLVRSSNFVESFRLPLNLRLGFCDSGRTSGRLCAPCRVVPFLSLPKAYREVFLLRDVQGLSNQEAASVLQISVPAVKTRILRARLMMRELLAPQFAMRWRDRVFAHLKRHGRSR
ncbi:MAG TPA: sigma factor-like helix-turn-helix DNA-binding protein [Acidobacteriota bacterium]|nr:sigma factor-like helix-turn-helix DNA-binding protein [Acidobacteriota bacterium]